MDALALQFNLCKAMEENEEGRTNAVLPINRVDNNKVKKVFIVKFWHLPEYSDSRKMTMSMHYFLPQESFYSVVSHLSIITLTKITMIGATKNDTNFNLFFCICTIDNW